MSASRKLFNSGVTMPAWHVPVDFRGTRAGWTPCVLLWTGRYLRCFCFVLFFPNSFTAAVYILQIYGLVISVFFSALKHLSLQHYAVICLSSTHKTNWDLKLWLNLGHLTGDKEHLFKDNVSPRNKDIKSIVTLKKKKKRQMKNQLSQGAGDSKASI